MNIVVLDGYAENPGDLSWDALGALGHLTVYDRTAGKDIIARIQDAEAIFINKVPITAEIIQAATKLKFICVTATGYNVVDVDAARERKIPVCNIPAYSSASVAQMVFAFLLEIASHVSHHSEAVKQGRWITCPDFCFWDIPLIELEGKTLGIIGYGTIGKRVAKIAVSLGMKVLASSRTAHPELETEEIHITDRDTVLQNADFITLHCPQNPESVGLINRNTIAMMKDGVILINTARGGCVVEQDVADALASEKMAYYAADVVSSEPMHADNPLLHAPNTLITPHIAWATMEARTRLMDIAVENLRAFMAGTPCNVVNGIGRTDR
ncbi:MAG: D-2-hydroxyacid dehydrogenase [Evtepia sp.]